MKRNFDKHKSAAEAVRNILVALRGGGSTNKSGLGYLAFPGYNFKAPQGAAFAVAKIARNMEADGLLRTSYLYHGDDYLGYSIKLTAKGEEAAK